MAILSRVCVSGGWSLDTNYTLSRVGLSGWHQQEVFFPPGSSIGDIVASSTVSGAFSAISRQYGSSTGLAVVYGSVKYVPNLIAYADQITTSTARPYVQVNW